MIVEQLQKDKTFFVVGTERIIGTAERIKKDDDTKKK